MPQVAVYDLDGCHRLLEAFWTRVRVDMESGSMATRDWLSTPALDRWVNLSFARPDPSAVRAQLLTRWRAAYGDYR